MRVCANCIDDGPDGLEGLEMTEKENRTDPADTPVIWIWDTDMLSRVEMLERKLN